MSPAAACLVGAARALPVAWLAPPLGGPARAARVVVAAVLVAVSWPALTAALAAEGLWSGASCWWG